MFEFGFNVNSIGNAILAHHRGSHPAYTNAIREGLHEIARRGRTISESRNLVIRLIEGVKRNIASGALINRPESVGMNQKALENMWRNIVHDIIR